MVEKDEMLLRAAEWISEAATLGGPGGAAQGRGLDFQFRGILRERWSWLLEESEPSQQNEAIRMRTTTNI